jgi:hypothetical protein
METDKPKANKTHILRAKTHLGRLQIRDGFVIVNRFPSAVSCFI